MINSFGRMFRQISGCFLAGSTAGTRSPDSACATRKCHLSCIARSHWKMCHRTFALNAPTSSPIAQQLAQAHTTAAHITPPPKAEQSQQSIQACHG